MAGGKEQSVGWGGRDKGGLFNRLPFGVCLLLLSYLCLAAPLVEAHPMGNFSISHYAGIRIEPGFLALRYLLDMAEIPTFQEMQRTGIVAEVDDPRVAVYLAQEAEALKQGLVLELNGRRLPLQLVSDDVLFPPGAGNLPTMKLGFLYRAALSEVVAGGNERLDYQDLNFPERAGWKEAVATTGQGIAVISSTVPEMDRSSQLSNYPTDLINSPPQVLEAHLRYRDSGLGAAEGGRQSAVGGQQSAVHSRQRAEGSRQKAVGNTAGAEVMPGIGTLGSLSQNPKSKIQNGLALRPNQQSTPRNAFTDLVAAKQIGWWFLVVAAAVAAGLGALHALEPGHGKTIVAAYLVGSRGTAAHACLLGLIVTTSHTAGVYLLGGITLYASRYVVPDRLYPWLGVISGLTIAGVGFYLFLRRRRGDAHSHSHPHVHPHVHHHEHELEAHGKTNAHQVPLETREEVLVHAHGYEHSHRVAFANEGPGAPRLVHAHGHDHPHPHPHHPAHGHEHHHQAHEGYQDHFHPADGSPAHDHSHSSGHSHSHSHVPNSGSVSYRELLALGITGGMVPCPAALVVLLSAVTLHRIGFGLFLIVAFSVGLATVLIGIGLLTVCAGRFMSRFKMEGPLIRRWLPMASAGVITLLGLSITVKAMVSTGILKLPL
jgi:nickel/cobalt transporter (NicO) family protein